MSSVPWVLISIGILLIIFLIIAVYFKKSKQLKTDYYTFFAMGIAWLPMGILFQIFFPESFLGMMFIFLGAAYTIIGLAHKKDWKKNHKSWKQLTKKEQKLKLIISVIFGILVFVGLITYYIFRG